MSCVQISEKVCSEDIPRRQGSESQNVAPEAVPPTDVSRNFERQRVMTVPKSSTCADEDARCCGGFEDVHEQKQNMLDSGSLRP